MTKSRSALVIEGIVIVASILLAFGIDAWWDERRAELDAREYIAQLIEKGVMTDVLLAGGGLDRIDVAPGSDLSEFLSDPVFLQMTSWRVNNLENVMDEVQIVEDSIHHILELLEKGVDTG